jgi:hypothetical protein
MKITAVTMLFHIIQNSALTNVKYCDIIPESWNSGARPE